jgi:hypothetical protein
MFVFSKERYSIFNVKHCKERKRLKDVLFINFRLSVNMF